MSRPVASGRRISPHRHAGNGQDGPAQLDSGGSQGAWPQARSGTGASCWMPSLHCAASPADATTSSSAPSASSEDRAECHRVAAINNTAPTRTSPSSRSAARTRNAAHIHSEARQSIRRSHSTLPQTGRRKVAPAGSKNHRGRCTRSTGVGLRDTPELTMKTLVGGWFRTEKPQPLGNGWY
jgi:hypothetical protein